LELFLGAFFPLPALKILLPGGRERDSNPSPWGQGESLNPVPCPREVYFSSSLPPGRWISAPSLARERDQGEGAGRGIQIPLPGGREMDSNPSPFSFPLPGQGEGLNPVPCPREVDFSPLPGQGGGFFLLPAPREMDFSPLPGQGGGFFLLPAPRVSLARGGLKSRSLPQGSGFQPPPWPGGRIFPPPCPQGDGFQPPPWPGGRIRERGQGVIVPNTADSVSSFTLGLNAWKPPQSWHGGGFALALDIDKNTSRQA